MTKTGKLWLITNGASGSNDDGALSALVAELNRAGAQPERVIDCQRDDLPDRETLDRNGVERLAIFTGDGTANTAISRIEGWTGEVIVLPGGTANLLAKELNGDAAPAEIIAALSAGTLLPITRNCVRTSQGIALVEVLAGPGATWSEVREGIRDGDIGGTATKAVEAVRQSAAGPMVMLTQPSIGRETGYAGVRLAPMTTGMEVEGFGAETIADYLKQGLALLRRNFRDGPHDELGEHPELVCRSADGSPIALMLDGERHDGASEERFLLAPLRVKLLGIGHG